MRRSLVVAAVVLAAPALSCACRRAAEGPATPAAAPVAAPGTAGAGPKGPSRDPARVPREYLVTVAAGSGEAAVREACGRFGVTGVEALGSGVYRVTVSEDPGPAGLEAAARADPRIQAVQPNFVYKAN